jgi:hypothetical protein
VLAVQVKILRILSEIQFWRSGGRFKLKTQADTEKRKYMKLSGEWVPTEAFWYQCIILGSYLGIWVRIKKIWQTTERRNDQRYKRKIGYSSDFEAKRKILFQNGDRGVGDLAQWKSACLASVRPWVRSLPLKKKKEKNQNGDSKWWWQIMLIC